MLTEIYDTLSSNVYFVYTVLKDGSMTLDCKHEPRTGFILLLFGFRNSKGQT